ncbi:MAG: DUF4199 domain-containing protein [Flavobacteriales bacterium]|nr:DUF4199 domain-containing protein [Flavobacteriales bacterium]
MKPVIQFGLFSGIVSAIWQYAKYQHGLTNINLGGLAGFVPHLFLFVVIAVAVYYQRSSAEFGVGNVPFKEAAKTGVYISIITGLCLAGYTMLYGLVINPTYLQEWADFVREGLEKQHKSQDIIEQQIAEINSTGALGSLMFGAFTTSLVIGMIGSMIIAGLLKREPEGSPE